MDISHRSMRCLSPASASAATPGLCATSNPGTLLEFGEIGKGTTGLGEEEGTRALHVYLQGMHKKWVKRKQQQRKEDAWERERKEALYRKEEEQRKKARSERAERREKEVELLVAMRRREEREMKEERAQQQEAWKAYVRQQKELAQERKRRLEEERDKKQQREKLMRRNRLETERQMWKEEITTAHVKRAAEVHELRTWAKLSKAKTEQAIGRVREQKKAAVMQCQEEQKQKEERRAERFEEMKSQMRDEIRHNNLEARKRREAAEAAHHTKCNGKGLACKQQSHELTMTIVNRREKELALLREQNQKLREGGASPGPSPNFFNSTLFQARAPTRPFSAPPTRQDTHKEERHEPLTPT